MEKNVLKSGLYRGLLIHIAPEDIAEVLDEVYRCTKHYIWGTEYYTAEYTMIDYRNHSNLLWKTNFSSRYLARFKDLRLVREERFKYTNSESEDVMFLLEKGKQAEI